LEKNLIFGLKNESQSKILIQPYVSDENNSLLKNTGQHYLEEWNNLPPVLRPSSEFIAKPGTETLLKTKIQNVPTQSPLLLTGSIGKKRAVAVLCQDIWKWKLQISNKESRLFDTFISSSVKWLNVLSGKNRLNVKTTKKIYAKGETVEFIASAYDETFLPLDEAEIKITVNNGEKNFDIVPESLGNGLYQAEFTPDKAASYVFEAKGILNSKEFGKAGGKFSVGEINIEKINLIQDSNLLLSLANLSKGKMIEQKDINELIEEVNRKYVKAQKFVYHAEELKLWSIEYILGFLILLFAVEWFLRKRSGLL